MAAELLSPAGGSEALIAAVQNGADAVYLGFGAFNARAGAHNFSDAAFRDAVAYCHKFGVKVYCTLNTLLTDRELPAAADLARTASDCGVDAILVQDWGVLALLRSVVPDVPLHASTQMSLHTLSGVTEAAKLGMSRAVLARELSREEIAEICARSPIEIEVFVHGALCMCYSGQCEMSAVIGERSGNRGMCAQPCRMPCGLHGKADGHALSLKDNNLADYVQELSDLGVACLKLEGRMKRPEYVAAITAIYARLLRHGEKPTAQEQSDLARAFSRNGFTQGYYLGAHGRGMFGVRPEDTRWPEDWFAELRRAYEKEDLRTVPVRFYAEIRANAPISLTADDGEGHRVRVTGTVPEPARTRALTESEVAGRLHKVGGTGYAVDGCAVALDDGLAVSAAALNALRRDALDRMTALRTTPPHRRTAAYLPPAPCSAPTAPPRLTVSLSRAEQLSEALCALSPALIMLPIDLLVGLDLSAYGEARFCAVLPRIYRTGDEPMLRAALQTVWDRGVRDATVGNLGHFALLRDFSFTLHGDFSLNVYNSLSLAFLRDCGLSSATVSFELRWEQLRDLQKCIPVSAIVYGRLPLMITENALGDGDSPALTDRRGERFPILSVCGGRSEIENAKTLYLADKPEWKQIGLTYANLRFTTESAEDCVRLLRRYRAVSDPAGSPDASPAGAPVPAPVPSPNASALAASARSSATSAHIPAHTPALAGTSATAPATSAPASSHSPASAPASPSFPAGSAPDPDAPADLTRGLFYRGVS